MSPGEKLRQDQRGLVYAATPASDFICGTLQLAAGMNLHVFTTGRGTPYGLAAAPVFNSAQAHKAMRDWCALPANFNDALAFCSQVTAAKGV